MLSHPDSKMINGRRAGPLRTLSLAGLTLFVSASMALAQGGGGCQRGGGAGGGGAGGSAGGMSGGSSLGQQIGGGGLLSSSGLSASQYSSVSSAAIVGQQMRQAQQAQVDQMAKVRRDVQQAQQQRVQQRTIALTARLAREERLAESAAKSKAIRLAASKKSNSPSSTLVASTDAPSAAKQSSR